MWFEGRDIGSNFIPNLTLYYKGIYKGILCRLFLTTGKVCFLFLGVNPEHVKFFSKLNKDLTFCLKRAILITCFIKLVIMKKIVISSCFGHEIMAVAVAKSLNLKVVIVPNKDNADDFNKESENILVKMLPFYSALETISFEEKETALAEGWDVIRELKEGRFDASLWFKMASSKLTPSFGGLRRYQQLEGKFNVLFVPQKLKSDGECGVSAAQQSLNPQVLAFMKGIANLVLGQHFHKVNDLETVETLAKEFGLYVPGQTENQEVFGIRGVAHAEYFNMYRNLAASVGIAGTHTWIMLALFPEIPQIILFNRNGVENWKDIESAYQKAGYRIFCIGFDENSNMDELSKEIEETYRKLF